jgi:beta-mannosidase
MITRLDRGWTLRSVGGQVPDGIGGAVLPATVPGTVHTDLLDAGLIPDPYLGTNEGALTWLHRTAWEYATALDVDAPGPDERVDLVFEGLDTVATVTLNGTELARTANQHRTHRLDARPLLRAGENALSVRFDSALEHAEAVQEQVGARPRAYDHPFNAVRKMACSFGWDWGPDLQTAGIWRPVGLHRWRVARLASVRPLATLDGATGHLAVHVDVERSGLGEQGQLAVRAVLSGLPGPDGTREASVVVPAGRSTAVVELEVPDAPVWWPVGHGDQPLVPLEVELSAGEGAGATVLDTYRRRIGFRSVALDTSSDEHGARFVLVVNGREVFVKGANWIPEDHLLTRITREDLAAAVDRAVAAHVNLLRVWGGGIYESEDFYELCDERGVLVWQDFLLACAAYAEEDPIRSEVVAEAREQVARLTPHPSLVIWNGSNENVWGHEDWGWKDELGDRTWGAGYYDDVFPAVLAELDPTRPYTPSSPASPGHDPEQVHPNDDRFGTHHEWEVWNRVDYTTWLTHVPRFASEFGFQAPPTWATLTRALAPEDLRKDSPAFLLHQKAEDGNGKLDRGLAPHLPQPATFPDWHWATQLNQARATTFAIEHLRSHTPRTMGSIVWQLNDCWPVTSWAVVDGDGRLKPAWYALRAAYAPRLVTLQPRDGAPHLVLVNDTDEAWEGTARVRRTAFDGAELAAQDLAVHVPPRSAGTWALGEDLLRPQDPAREVVVADVGDLRGLHLFAEDVALRYDPQPLQAQARAVPGGYEVVVTARSFARDVAVLAERVAPDAVVDDMLVPLLAGEQRTFTVRTAASVDPQALTAPEVLRAATSSAPPTTPAR